MTADSSREPTDAVVKLVNEGRLVDAVAELNAAVRNQPAEISLRTALFELLCFAEDFDRAEKQLDVLASFSGPDARLALQIYRGLLQAERTRRAVLEGSALPKFVTPPSDDVQQHLVRLKSSRASAAGFATDEDAEASAVPIGSVDGRPFSTIRDADDRTAPVLEAFIGHEYLWVPFDRIRRLEITAPARLRDLLWAHAHLDTIDGHGGDVFLPVLYAGSGRDADDLVRLGRKTDWRPAAVDHVHGVGQRVLLVDDTDVPLLEIRVLELNAPRAADA